MPQAVLRRLHLQHAALPRIAMRPQRQLAVPMRRHLDVIGRMAMDALHHPRRFPVYLDRRERRIVDGVSGKRLVAGNTVGASRTHRDDHRENESGENGEGAEAHDAHYIPSGR
ncbi:hypothetical protein GCM10010402_05780 [Actinomadura luteofluorescens]